MDQLITHITERTGITADQACEVMQVVTSYLKDKLPAPMAAQVDGLLSRGDDDPAKPAAGSAGAGWTSGEVVGTGQGDGPRADTGGYDARQFVGAGQGDQPATGEPTKRSD
jgi:hypothetical protein